MNIEEFRNSIPHVCHYCLHRHSGCNSNDVHVAYEEGGCPDFALGKCFFCDTFVANGMGHAEGVCQEANIWDYCGSPLCFKGYYEEDDSEYEPDGIEEAPDCVVPHAQKSFKRGKRREQNKKHKDRVKQIAKSSHRAQFSPYRIIDSKPVYETKIEEVPEHTVKRRMLFSEQFYDVVIPAHTRRSRILVDENKVEPYAVRLDHGSKYKQFLKKQSNKKIRRSRELYKGWASHKLFDFWWELY